MPQPQRGSFSPMTVALAVTGVALVLILNLLDSRAGRALRALSTAEIGAACMGIDVHRHKMMVFVVSALFAAVAGCLYVHHNTFVSPESFDFIASTMLVVMVALGGTGHFWGALAGALLYTVLPELLRSVGDLRFSHDAIPESPFFRMQFLDNSPCVSARVRGIIPCAVVHNAPRHELGSRIVRVAVVVEEIGNRETAGVDGIALHRPFSRQLVFVALLPLLLLAESEIVLRIQPR